MPSLDVSIAWHFADLPDPRIDRTNKYSLGDILPAEYTEKNESYSFLCDLSGSVVKSLFYYYLPCDNGRL